MRSKMSTKISLSGADGGEVELLQRKWGGIRSREGRSDLLNRPVEAEGVLRGTGKSSGAIDVPAKSCDRSEQIEVEGPRKGTRKNGLSAVRLGESEIFPVESARSAQTDARASKGKRSNSAAAHVEDAVATATISPGTIDSVLKGRGKRGHAPRYIEDAEAVSESLAGARRAAWASPKGRSDIVEWSEESEVSQAASITTDHPIERVPKGKGKHGSAHGNVSRDDASATSVTTDCIVERAPKGKAKAGSAYEVVSRDDAAVTSITIDGTVERVSKGKGQDDGVRGQIGRDAGAAAVPTSVTPDDAFHGVSKGKRKGGRATNQNAFTVTSKWSQTSISADVDDNGDLEQRFLEHLRDSLGLQVERSPLQVFQDDSAEGQSRSKLVSAVFCACDHDSDGLLKSAELRCFAEAARWFDGSASEWGQEYLEVCAELQTDPAMGLDMELLGKLVDDHVGCFCTNAQLGIILCMLSSVQSNDD